MHSCDIHGDGLFSCITVAEAWNGAHKGTTPWTWWGPQHGP